MDNLNFSSHGMPWNACSPCPYYDFDGDKCFCHEVGVRVPEDADCYDIDLEEIVVAQEKHDESLGGSC